MSLNLVMRREGVKEEALDQLKADEMYPYFICGETLFEHRNTIKPISKKLKKAKIWKAFIPQPRMRYLS